jgi:hypothetical protein
VLEGLWTIDHGPRSVYYQELWWPGDKLRAMRVYIVQVYVLAVNLCF